MLSTSEYVLYLVLNPVPTLWHSLVSKPTQEPLVLNMATGCCWRSTILNEGISFGTIFLKLLFGENSKPLKTLQEHTRIVQFSLISGGCSGGGGGWCCWRWLVSAKLASLCHSSRLCCLRRSCRVRHCKDIIGNSTSLNHHI